MTLPDEFTNAVREWWESYGEVACTRSNGRTELMAIYLRLLPGKSEDQAYSAVTKAVRTRRGIIAPESTRTGLKRKAVGAHTSAHPSEMKLSNEIHNPINNPINGPIKRSYQRTIYGPIQRAINKARLEDENREIIKNNPLIADHLLSPEELERVFQNIIGTKYAELGGLTLKEALESKKYAVYVCACLCLYVSMSLCLYVSVSLCLCVSSSRSTNSTSAPTPHS